MTKNQPMPPMPASLTYGGNTVERMQAAIGKEIDDVREAGRIEMTKLQQALQDADARMRREVAELEQAMRHILDNRMQHNVPQTGVFAAVPDLSPNPDGNIARVAAAHVEQDAVEGVRR